MCVDVCALAPVCQLSVLARDRRRRRLEASEGGKHHSTDRLFPSKGLASHPGAVVTIFQRDLHLITGVTKCANQS